MVSFSAEMYALKSGIIGVTGKYTGGDNRSRWEKGWVHFFLKASKQGG